MERLTEKDQYSHEYKVQAKNLDSHCVAKDKRGYVTYYGHHIDKLAEYENFEEQGLLLRLPCRIGADVYFVPSETNYKLNILQGHPESNRVYHQTVERITFTPNGWYLECDKDLEYATDHIFVDKLYKDTWFLSQAEAEQKLKEMESN